MARILIADDHESMRMALRATVKLQPHWEVCGEATDGREAVAKAQELQPDLIVLDFKMPIANGIKAGSEIFSSRPNIPILMYTLYKTRELEVAAKLVGIRQASLFVPPDMRMPLACHTLAGRSHHSRLPAPCDTAIDR